MSNTFNHTAFSLQGMAPLLQVFDMPASLGFYRDILQFTVIQSSGTGDDVDWVLLQHSGIELMLNTAYEKRMRPSTPDMTRIVAHSDTSVYFGCPAIDDLYEYLFQKGVVVNKPEVTGYGWKALNLADPDGYHLCFHWPLEDDAEDTVS